MKRSLKDYIFLMFRGIAMGAADVVPGVSGGTIAFISGIYEELINSIKSIVPAFKTLFKKGISAFWKEINGNFLLAVGGGIGIAIISLAKILKELLETHPKLIWGFFFGLIVASAIFVIKKITKWNIANVISLILGIAIAFTITMISPAQTSEAYWFILLAGSLAICAMILPGISGAFILLLLGKYKFVLEAVHEFKVDVILVFAAGAGCGLLLFSNVLSWLLKKYHNLTVALLGGFMIGSLNKVWPWKETLSFYTNSKGKEMPLDQMNILPTSYEGESQLFFVAGLAILGFMVVFLFEKFIGSKAVVAVEEK